MMIILLQASEKGETVTTTTDNLLLSNQENETISKNMEITSTGFFATLKHGFVFEKYGKESEKTVRQGSKDRNGNCEKALLFRSAAEMLTKLRTWGCSLNLVLLLHQQAKI